MVHFLDDKYWCGEDRNSSQSKSTGGKINDVFVWLALDMMTVRSTRNNYWLYLKPTHYVTWCMAQDRFTRQSLIVDSVETYREGSRGRSLTKITTIFQISLLNFKFQLNFMQISYFRVLLYFKFLGKFHRNLVRLTLLWCYLTLKVHRKREKDETDEVSELKCVDKQYV